MCPHKTQNMAINLTKSKVCNLFLSIISDICYNFTEFVFKCLVIPPDLFSGTILISWLASKIKIFLIITMQLTYKSDSISVILSQLNENNSIAIDYVRFRIIIATIVDWDCPGRYCLKKFFSYIIFLVRVLRC